MRNLLKVLFVLVLSGCVTYNGAQLRALSDKNLAAVELTAEMCSDFATASKAAVEGEDHALPYLGRAAELQKLSVILDKHSGQCFLVLERDLTEEQRATVLEAFKRSWGNAKKLAED